MTDIAELVERLELIENKMSYLREIVPGLRQAELAAGRMGNVKLLDDAMNAVEEAYKNAQLPIKTIHAILS